VIAPGCNIRTAQRVAERIRQACEASPYTASGLRQTVSIGVSAFPAPSEAASLLNDTDKALYIAKANGRNCVHHAEQPAQQGAGQS